jgi:hypothetical protein
LVNIYFLLFEVALFLDDRTAFALGVAAAFGVEVTMVGAGVGAGAGAGAVTGAGAGTGMAQHCLARGAIAIQDN